ncbi:MAG: CocE/NonD family hydrolase [Vicinamibacteria bacterium]|nr:CocE/NonD family hydrolase [Vicinamibacteria bacterium]
MHVFLTRLVLGAGLLAVSSSSLTAQEAPSPGLVRARYTKHEFRIRMRDGVSLFTAVYTPKDTSRSYPIMMERTPYSVAPYGIDNYPASLGPSPSFLEEGFIFVYQDVRGRYMSEGAFIEETPHKPEKRTPRDVDESSDAYDTIEWLLKNVRGNTGKVGLWGISYPGFYAAAALPGAHPAIKAVSPQAPVTDVFRGDDAFHNGAFMLAANYGFYVNFVEQKTPARPAGGADFDYGTPDGYEYYLKLGTLQRALDTVTGKSYFRAYLDHTTYDEFWRSRDISAHMKNITPAVLVTGGLFDAEDLQGPQRLFRALAKDSPQTPSTLVLGPWRHGGWARGDGAGLGNLDFGQKTSEFYREEIEFPFFMRHLKGVEAAIPRAWVFETGRNEWHKHDAWPPAEARGVSYYLGPRGSLLSNPPPVQDGGDEYTADPAKPVPYLSYVNMGMRGDYMTEDQRFAAARPDVLVYETAPLEFDVRTLGPVKVKLNVSSTGTDADFVVKLIDVYPGDAPDLRPQPSPRPPNAVRMGGYQQLVRGEPFRAKFRRSLEKPEPLIPGKVETIEFEMPDIAHTFRPGHKIMVQVQSSWFPLVDRNPQKFMDISKAVDADFVKAAHRVHRGSSVTLSVVP